MNKLYVIGDSFVMPCHYANGFNPLYDDWVKLLQTFNPSLEFLTDGDPSRDFQTILDIWIKFLPEIDNTDTLIICVPYLGRVRLPLHKDNWQISKLNKKIITRHSGIHNFNISGKLNYKLDDIDDSPKSISKLEYQQLINISNSSVLNQLEVADSLVKITKSAKTILFSWDTIPHDYTWLFDKEKIEKGIGIPFHTLTDDFKETKGKRGFENDLHWSGEYNRFFAIWINSILNPRPLKKLL